MLFFWATISPLVNSVSSCISCTHHMCAISCANDLCNLYCSAYASYISLWCAQHALIHVQSSGAMFPDTSSCIQLITSFLQFKLGFLDLMALVSCLCRIADLHLRIPPPLFYGLFYDLMALSKVWISLCNNIILLLYCLLYHSILETYNDAVADL